MQYLSANSRNQPRAGMVLLVVMALLALFSSVAIGFVFYADAEAVGSKLANQALAKDQPDVDTETLAAYFLNQLIYPTDNIYSALRGWDLSRSIYGYNPGTLNHTPYNGVGRLALMYTDADFGIDNFALVNYTTYWDPNQPANPTINFVRTPEFYGKVPFLPAAPPPSPSYLAAGGPTYRYVGGANAPWTYYDTNSLWLAQVGADGTVYQPSFVRSNLAAYFATRTPAQQAAAAKYMSMRPDPNWHPGFAVGLPDSDLGGDVKNKDHGPGTLIGGAYHNNDSIWMDLGFPVKTAPNGQRFKPLFAPLIVDLSNRLHLWAHGNPRGAGNTHVSNRGMGPTEVNLSRVLTNNPELQQLYALKYGSAGAAAGTALGILGGPWYSRHDFDALDPVSGASSSPLSLPGGFLPFPGYPSGWDNANAGEVGGNPLGLNLYQPIGTNSIPLPMSNLEALVRFGGTNSPAVTSELFRRMPATFSNVRARNMVTQHNWYLDRITAAPVISWNPNTMGNYQMGPAGAYPVRTAAGAVYPNYGVAPNYGMPLPPYPANSDFTGDWRSNLGTLLRINLNRTLLDYPAPNKVGVIVPPSYPAYNAALVARQQFARDLYNALIKVTGAQDPNVIPPAAVVLTSADYRAARWLAQLAVNIVDYIDNDDFVTPFQWYPPAPGIDCWVFGTELPRLVLNEAYAQNDNLTTDPGVIGMKGATTNKLNVWVELHNPFKTTPAGETYPNEAGAARLRTAGDGEYAVVVCKSSAALTAAMREPGNNLGDPEFNNIGPPRTLSTSTDWPGGGGKGKGKGKGPIFNRVLPANGAASDPSATNVGFFVLGPTQTTFLGGRDPSFPVTHRSPEMSIITPPDPVEPTVTVLLRRQAIPQLPPNPPIGGAYDPSLPYNPFITVDYLDGLPVWDNRAYNVLGPILMPPATTSFNTFGRRQPYAAQTGYGTAAYPSQVPAQTNAVAGQPANTFYSQNLPRDNYSWLTHLDRPVVNQLELLHVSGYKPHELTQQFAGRVADIAAGGASEVGNTATINTTAPHGLAIGMPVIIQSVAAGGYNGTFAVTSVTPTSFTYANPTAGLPVSGGGTVSVVHRHYAPWLDPTAGIYRVLDVLGVPSQMAGAVRGGRTPGNLNINTMTEPEIFAALCDAHPTAAFSPAEVASVYANLLASRTVTGPGTFPGEGTPFKGFAAGNMLETLFRPNATGQPMFAVGPNAPHLYQRAALLQKIYNNAGTTSNTFGVWWTVGFFEVVDESVKPARLGAEIGRDQNKHIRHRFFAIVDRSGLQLFNTISGPNLQNPGYPGDQRTLAGTSQPMYAAPFGGTLASGVPWSIQPGMLLEVDSGVNMEVVVVKTVDPVNSYFTADFTMNHNPGVPIVCRGNPGPRVSPAQTAPFSTPYNPRQDAGVVLHLSVIQ